MESKVNDLNLNALFIGDKAENGQIYKALLNELVDVYLGMASKLYATRYADHYAGRKSSESFAHTINKTKRRVS